MPSCPRRCRKSRTAPTDRSTRSACCVNSRTGSAGRAEPSLVYSSKVNCHDPAIPLSSPCHSRRRSLPEALLRETGLFLIAYAALIGWLGRRQSMPKALVMIVIAGNTAHRACMRANRLSSRVFETYDAINDAICAAWRNLILRRAHHRSTPLPGMVGTLSLCPPSNPYSGISPNVFPAGSTACLIRRESSTAACRCFTASR